MFIGYASLAVPFAFAMAALWMKKYDEWTKVSMPWVLLSLVSLGTAIMLGGYWAYETLGWGGYWGWDPVENASLVPWLATAALTHGMLLQRGRKRFRRLNLVLAVAAYPAGGLCHLPDPLRGARGLLGPLFCRSRDHRLARLQHGFLPRRLHRAARLPMAGDSQPRSVTNPSSRGPSSLSSASCSSSSSVWWFCFGTSAPLISRIWGEPAQVGPEFYNAMGYWIAVAFAVFLGGTPFLAWSRARKGAGKVLGGTLAVTAVCMLVAALLGLTGGKAYVYVGAVVFNIVANGWAVLDYGRAKRWRLTGGPVAHVGMGLMMLAFLTTGWLDEGMKIRLHQDQPAEVLGYTMTFRGVEKPTPTARDAMVVEITDKRGKNFVLKPKMWVNKKSNQLIANPDIKVFLTTDLYLAPVEFEPGKEPAPSGRFMLGKDQPQQFNDWTLTFLGFDLSKQSSMPGALTVGVAVQLERPDHETVVLEPTMISTDQGVEPIAVDIPGVPGARLRSTGMNVDSGMVRVEVLGLGGGIGRTATMHKGETLAYEGLEITFSRLRHVRLRPRSRQDQLRGGLRCRTRRTPHRGRSDLSRWESRRTRHHSGHDSRQRRHHPEPGTHRCRERHGSGPGLRPDPAGRPDPNRRAW